MYRFPSLVVHIAPRSLNTFPYFIIQFVVAVFQSSDGKASVDLFLHHCLQPTSISARKVGSAPLVIPQFTPRITALPFQAFLPFRLSFQIRSHHASSSCNQEAMSKKGGRSVALRWGLGIRLWVARQ
jgi:hypothetical protein